MMLEPLTVDSDSGDDATVHRPHVAPPPAPKRRKTNRQACLAGFAAAARLELSNPTTAVERIQSCYRGHRVRRDVARLRPTSASTSASDGPLDEFVPEEIEADDASCCLTDDLTSLTLITGPVDSALEASGEFLESSGDSVTLTEGLRDFRAALATGPQAQARACSICLQEMPRRRRQPHEAAADEDGPPAEPATKVTLECGHKFHRRCLLAWCRRQPPGHCPMCRAEVRVRVRTRSRPPTGEASSSSAAPFVQQ